MYVYRTQSLFTKSIRPMPYGEEGTHPYPGIGEYDVSKRDQFNSTGFSFGNSQKLPDNKFNGTTPVKYYDIRKDIKQPGKGFTMRPYYDGIKNKDAEEFPAPNHYNPKLLESNRKIINYTGPRSELYEKDLVKYPSPQKHVTSPEFYKTRKSLSFTKQIRRSEEPVEGPGPAQYNVQGKLSEEQGYMGHKLKKPVQDITPAGSNYSPMFYVTRPTAQRVINYATNRSDFSKSITRHVGPGEYATSRLDKSELGKMSKSLKF